MKIAIWIYDTHDHNLDIKEKTSEGEFMVRFEYEILFVFVHLFLEMNEGQFEYQLNQTF